MAAPTKQIQPFFVYSHCITALLASRTPGYYQPGGNPKSAIFASVMLSSFHMARVRIYTRNGGEGNG